MLRMIRHPDGTAVTVKPLKFQQSGFETRHARDHVPQRRLAVGQRQQVVQVLAVDAGPAQVVADPARATALLQRLQRVIAAVGITGVIGFAHATHEMTQPPAIGDCGC